MIYYPLLDWRKDWGGGTVIWTDHDQDKKEQPKKIEKHIAYTGNRLMVFPAKRLHQAMPVSKNCFKLRSCIVFKCFTEEVDDARLDHYKN
jgi:Rps23 Pro-64 3,4-dihydroxylase Tpa1-like proline 4-hydroxylase